MRLTMANDLCAAILFLLRDSRDRLMAKCWNRRWFFNGKGQLSRDPISFFFLFPSFFLFSSITNDPCYVWTLVAFVTNFFRASAKRKTAWKIHSEFVFSSERFQSSKRDDAGARTDPLRSSSRRRTDESSPMRPLITLRSFYERVASGCCVTASLWLRSLASSVSYLFVFRESIRLNWYRSELLKFGN